MSFLDRVKAAATTAASQIKTRSTELSSRLADEVTKYKNKDFLVAIVTGSALVALADGTISPEERSAMANYLRISEELKVFNGQEIVDEFNKAVALFEFDYKLGEVEALKRIAKIKSNEGAARTLVRVCISLANSDNNFDAKEKAAVTQIAKELGLDPSEFLG